MITARLVTFLNRYPLVAGLQKIESQVDYDFSGNLDSNGELDKNGRLTLEGGVKGLYTITEAALIIEPRGNIYAVVLDTGKRFLYFTNDQKYIEKLPPAIEEWVIGVESRRSQPGEVPKLPSIQE